MNKHFLVTVSNDYDHLTGVEFICSFFKQFSEHQITLLHISRLDAADMNKTLMKMWDKPEEGVTGPLTVGARKALEKSKRLLSKSNMSIDQMITKTFPERYGKIKDILKEGASGLYDAIILGKRASYTLQWFFERPADETAKAIIQDSSLTSPLWICPEPEQGRKHVLIGVDGSVGSMRAVDHVGYILSKQDQHTITLLHVENGAGLDSDAIFQRSARILNDHHIGDERIRRETTWGINVASTITSYAEKSGFAAIAVGLDGVDQGILKRINLAGGTTSGLIERAEKISLWCCP
ncbi:MAG: universal stress protein [Desulfofustis sp.]|nr:universal stress protein [Desulfofustis sp.]NNK58571.1 universal stress protein [Desulfofustis sp.]